MNARTKALIGAVAALLALPAGAAAATVELNAGTLDFAAGDEANQLFVGKPAPNQVFISDTPGTVLATSGLNCSNPDGDNDANCTGTVNQLDIQARGGDDTIDVSSPSLDQLTGFSILSAGDGDDVVRGSIGDDGIVGGFGDDLLEGGEGSDFLQGGEGHDLASYESETDPVTVTLDENTSDDGVAGEDDVNDDGAVEGVIGGSGGDTITGNNDPNEIHGRGGGDTVLGQGGADDLYGGAGQDEVSGGNGADDISGDGGRGSGAPASDILEGNLQVDRVRYAERSEPVTIDLLDAGTDGSAGEADELTGFEHVEGGTGDDTLRGDDNVNQLQGGPGNDTLAGRVGDDEYTGGTGADTVTHSARNVPVTVDLSAGTGTVDTESEDYTGIENLVGGTASDNLTGDGGPNTLDGFGGGDVIDGKQGPDRLLGGNNDDTLRGSEGGDTIYGDAGLDTADGGPGEDSLRMRDSEADTIECGEEFDSAIVDPIDTLAGCESSDNGVPPDPVEVEVPVEVPVDRIVQVPVPTPVPGPATPAQPAPVDSSRPSIDLASLKSTQKLSSFKKGLTVSVGCNEPCSFEIELLGSASTVKLARTYDLRLASKSLSRSSSRRSTTLKPSSRLLKGHKKLSVQLKVTAVDAAGNESTKTKTMKVR